MMPATTVFEAAPSLSSELISSATPPADIDVDFGGIRGLLAGPGLALDLDVISAPKGSPCPYGWSRVVLSDRDLFLRVATVVRC